MTKFGLKSLLLLLSFIALAIALVMSRMEIEELRNELVTYRNEMRQLTIEDENLIHAIQIPGFGRKAWRWRVYLPEDKEYRIRLAFDDIPQRGLPKSPPDNVFVNLPKGESILSASVVREGEGWGLSLRSETEGSQNFSFTTDIAGRDTKWLEKRGGCSQTVAGFSSTQTGEAEQPFTLLSFRDGLSPRPGVTMEDPNPTDGIQLWIQPKD
ncbi:MAG: hypothetical protein AAF802_31275 [Planctomycetota bacterium]